jgi:DNA polymerase I-like protein with 3'-5' exonuclease and polymerase domains
MQDGSKQWRQISVFHLSGAGQIGFGVDLAWVQRLVAGYFSKFAGIFKWRQAVVGRTKVEKQVRTRIGSVINVADDVTDNSLFNWPVQTDGADGFKLALCLIADRLEGVDAHIVHTQHDEIIVEVRDAIEDQVKEIVKESMEEAVDGRGIGEDCPRGPVCGGNQNG